MAGAPRLNAGVAMAQIIQESQAIFFLHGVTAMINRELIDLISSLSVNLHMIPS